MVASGIVMLTDALPSDDAVAAPSVIVPVPLSCQTIAIPSPAPYPRRVTVAVRPTEDVDGLMAILGITATEALALRPLVAPVAVIV